MRFLLVEDEPLLRQFFVDALESSGWACDAAANAREGEGLAQAYPYDALVVDVQLPEGRDAGFELVSRLRMSGLTTPVLFVTARGEASDRVRGLDLGGDDYLVKPIHLEELRARLRALVRRDRPVRSNALQHGDLHLDWNARAVSKAGKAIHLTAKEYAVLELLASNPGRLFSAEEIIERVWSADFDGDRKIVAIYVRLIRSKLGDEAIETVRGLGYRFPVDPHT